MDDLITDGINKSKESGGIQQGDAKQLTVI